jgi:hypothetical protein
LGLGAGVLRWARATEVLGWPDQQAKDVLLLCLYSYNLSRYNVLGGIHSVQTAIISDEYYHTHKAISFAGHVFHYEEAEAKFKRVHGEAKERISQRNATQSLGNTTERDPTNAGTLQLPKLYILP